MPRDPAKLVGRLKRLIEEAAELTPATADAWIERARLAVAAAYGEQSANLTRFEEIRYSLGMWTDSTPDSAFDRAKMGGVRDAVGMLQAFVEDLEEGAEAGTRPGQPGGDQVFVVHGRDEGVREQVARLLERLELEAIILHEKPDRGRTVIEKFEQHALRVGYAVVLLTPDDFARGPDDSSWPEEPNRARQNVILELSYFMGSLGRSRTAALYAIGTELPSDIHGLLSIPLDESWQLKLAKEMRDAGLPVDLNRL
jgi:predicted nucleotide-binding protein